jgi:hypothetical protein
VSAQHAEARETQSRTKQMQPDLDRTAAERAEIDKQIAANQSNTRRS